MVGVGMEFDSQRMIITGLRPGCAAAYSKSIAIGDQMAAVDGVETYDFKRARELILGTQGSTVNITFKKNGSGQLYTVPLLRGTADYIHMAERCKHLDSRIAQLEGENKNLQETPVRATSNDVKAQVSAQVNLAALQKKVVELETENHELQHAINRRVTNGASPANMQAALQEKEKSNELLQKQVAQLQKLIGEKDAQINDVKAKSRDLQGSLAQRLKDLEQVLKDRVEAKNERLVELSKHLMDSRAETEGLRTENQSLRNVVQQTNQKLNALISMQMEAAERGGGSVNEELRMLRAKTAGLEAEIQRIRVPHAHAAHGTRQAEEAVEVVGLQMDDDDNGGHAEHASLSDAEHAHSGPDDGYENYSYANGNGWAAHKSDTSGVELSTRPSQHTFTSPPQRFQSYADAQRSRAPAPAPLAPVLRAPDAQHKSLDSAAHTRTHGSRAHEQSATPHASGK